MDDLNWITIIELAGPPARLSRRSGTKTDRRVPPLRDFCVSPHCTHSPDENKLQQMWRQDMPMIIRTSFWMFLLGLLLTGCGTLPLHPDNPSPPETENNQIEPKNFSSYCELFKFIAKNEGFEPGDADNGDFLLKLAADSKIEACQAEGFKLPVIVVTPNYYYYFDYSDGAVSMLRGAQGNGKFYLLLPLRKNLTNGDSADPGFRLVGIAEGNGYEWSSSNFVPQFITRWHISAGESPESVYEWDGKVFKLITK